MFDVMAEFSNYIGMVGVILILIAYYYVSVERMSASSMKFQLLNFFGAWLILFSLFFHWNLASVAIEIAWIIISVIAICKIVTKTKLV